MFVDTNIIIDSLRGEKNSKHFLEKHTGSIKISVIVKLELLEGLKTKSKIAVLNKKVFDALQISTVYIDEDVSVKAEGVFTDFRHSKGISINDAFIAATALVHDEELVTRNKKHFGFIPNLKILKPY